MTDVPSSSSSAPRLPELRSVSFADIRAALAEGWRDFGRAPLMGAFFGAVYAFGGVGLAAAAIVFNAGWFIYPSMLGFALIGPFAAVGLYEISRRLERGERPTWGGVLGVIWAERKGEIAWMGFVMLFVLIVWMYQVRMLVALFLGLEPFHGFEGAVEVLFTTGAGLAFLAVGHVIGAVLALIMFSLTVVSIPLLLDREIDFVSAMITSVKSVGRNKVPMIGWGLFVVIVLIVSSIPAFMGLLVTLPVLGCATWHLYRRAVAPAT